MSDFDLQLASLDLANIAIQKWTATNWSSWCYSNVVIADCARVNMFGEINLLGALMQGANKVPGQAES